MLDTQQQLTIITTMKTVSFINISEIVPKNWGDWFYDLIAETSFISWGDAEHTLIDRDRLYEISKDALNNELARMEDYPPVDGEDVLTKEIIQDFLSKIENCGAGLIDLEN